MKIYNLVTSLLITTFFSGCAIEQYFTNNIIENKNYNNEITKLNKPITIKNKILNTEYFKNYSKFSKNQIKLIKIIEDDKYSSLCGDKYRFNTLKKIDNIKKINESLDILFISYVNNLANSCINQSKFKQTLAKKKYKLVKQNYEVYNQKINKTKLLKLFHSNNVSVESILKPYIPKHPNFMKFINIYNNSKLTKIQKYKLKLNIERLKILRHYNSNNFIQLNIPSYDFTLYENGNIAKNFGTVVGSTKDQTPVLSSELSHFIVNPTWNIPDSIAKKSIIPRALKDKNYLRKKNIVIRKNYHLDSEKFRFNDISWNIYLKKNVKYIPYKFIQLPSRTNGMGRVKYMFHNSYAVYMHDTIGTWRFKIPKEKFRFVSHGCVRLEHPLAFMKHLTKKYTKKTYKNVRGIYDSGEMNTISLSKRLAVHITYMTAYIKNGKIKFYKDIYGYDRIQKLDFIN